MSAPTAPIPTDVNEILAARGTTPANAAPAKAERGAFVAPRPASVVVPDATAEYLSKNAAKLNQMAPRDLVTGLVNFINMRIAQENKQSDGPKMPPQTGLGFAEIATVMEHLYVIINISPSGINSDPDLDMLAIYDGDPESPSYGTYQTSFSHFRRIARRYCYNLTAKAFEEVLSALRDSAPRVPRGTDRDLVAVKNGIFNYATKELMPFDPRHVFLTKTAVNYVEDPVNPVIEHPEDGTVWDVEDWMKELSDDEGVPELLWQVTGAIIRPYVSWNKSAWFYSEQGNNGKGTLVHLMRNICGDQAHTSIPVADFGKDFMLEPLTRASAILVDENDVGTHIDRAANLKAIITNDVISINRKYKQPIAYQFYGFMVQCLNEFPKVKDKSESFNRRALFIPFTKTFTGRERRYIKDDYLNRPEVLEYVQHRVLNMNYYTFSEPEAVRSALAEYREYNDPVRAFWTELHTEFTWDLLPFPFLHQLYQKWMAVNMPSSKPLGRNTFIKDLVAVVRNSDSGWECSDQARKIATAGRINRPEPLVAKYDLQEWQNPAHPRTAPGFTIPVAPSASYRGVERIGATPTPPPITPPITTPPPANS